MTRLAQSVLNNEASRRAKSKVKRDIETESEKRREEQTGPEFKLFVSPAIAKFLQESAEKEGRPRPKLKVYKPKLNT